MRFVLHLTITCNGEQGEFDEQADAAYEAGCDEGRYAGSLAGTDDGLACLERAEVPVEAARTGMIEYCDGEWPSDEGQPCEWWDSGYRDCWLDGYDQSYRIGWEAADCETDSGS